METATILEKQFEALKRQDYLEKLRAGELDEEAKQKSSSTLTRRSFPGIDLSGRFYKFCWLRGPERSET